MRPGLATGGNQFSWNVADWLASSGSDAQIVKPIGQQKENINLPLRSYHFGGVPGTTNHAPYIYGAKDTLLAPWYVKFPNLDAGALASVLVAGRNEGEYDADTYVSKPPQGSTIIRPYTLAPPCAFLFSMAVTTLNADAFVMAGLRGFTFKHRFPAAQYSVQNDDVAWAQIVNLLTDPAPGNEFNSYAALMFHGGDLDGTYRQYRKGFNGIPGYPNPLSDSSQATPLAMAGGPHRGAIFLVTDDNDAGAAGYQLARTSDTVFTVSGGAVKGKPGSLTDASRWVAGTRVKITAGVNAPVYGTIVSATHASTTLTVTLSESVVVAGLSLGTTGDTVEVNGPDPLTWRGGVLITHGGIYGLIGGSGDTGNEYHVVPFADQRVSPDMSASAGFEMFVALATRSDGYSGSSGYPRLYSMAGIEFADPSALQRQIRDSRVLVL